MHMDISHELFRMEMYRKNAGTPSRDAPVLCAPAQATCIWTFQKSHVLWKFTGVPDPNPATPVLCEPAQSKRTWTFHKSDFVQKNTGKLPDPRHGILCEPAQSKRTWTFQMYRSHFCVEIYRENARPPATTSIKHRVFTVIVRTPSVWGINSSIQRILHMGRNRGA